MQSLRNQPDGGMGNPTIGHGVEAVLWLLLVAFLYAYSFEFDKEIEIYQFGATAWPRAILLLIAIAAIGQFVHHWGDSRRLAASADATSVARNLDSKPHHPDLRQHLSTVLLLSLPFAYMVLPGWIQSWFAKVGFLMSTETLHTIKLGCAGILLWVYVVRMRNNLFGAMLTLPIFFGALLQDFGFYSLAPFFVVGVMGLMGERRRGWMALITVLIMSVMLLLFVKVLYVGLPTGNISPFYEIGSGLVNILQ